MGISYAPIPPAGLTALTFDWLVSGKSGQLKAQAQAFQPKAQMLANKQGAGEAYIMGKQPEAVVPVVAPDEPPSSSTNKSTATLMAEAATSAAKQKDELKEGKIAAKSPTKTLAKTLARASRPQSAAWQEVKSESGPVEDLDELHTLQVSLWPLAAVTNPICCPL